MTKLVFPGVCIPSAGFAWGVNDAPAGSTWSLQFYQNGSTYARSANGVIGADGSYGALMAPVPLGDYEVLFIFGTGERIVVPLQSLANMEFVWRPDYQASLANKPTTNNVQFGDGYSQVSPTGINNNPAEWSLQFSGVGDIEEMQINLFLASMKGATPFFWKDSRGVRQRYRCADWSTNFIGENEHNVSARFTQTFI